jgi:hypothetical protein
MLVPLNVVLPETVTVVVGVAVAEPDMEKFPDIASAVPGIVLVPLPLRIRLS